MLDSGNYDIDDDDDDYDDNTVTSVMMMADDRRPRRQLTPLTRLDSMTPAPVSWNWRSCLWL